MFTGIVREIGRIEELAGEDDTLTLTLRAPETAREASVGDSVSVNGVCLTATDVADGTLSFEAVPETLARSAFGRLRRGSTANVEPALRAGEPFGGHVVQGHVDGVGRVRSVEPEGEGGRLTIDVPEELARYCVEKGSIAIDGVSLTLATVDGRTVAIALVPHTLAATTLGSLEPGDEVNVEVDILAKYVERLLGAR